MERPDRFVPPVATTGDVSVQTIETSVLNAMNSRTMEILADWEPAILSGSNVTVVESATPKRRSLRVAQQLDKVGPSSDFQETVNA